MSTNIQVNTSVQELASKKKERPLSEHIVQIINERALGCRNPEVFGSSENVYEIGYETLIPAYTKTQVEPHTFRVTVGSPDCQQPYSCSIFNASALSFGPLGKNFILALNKAAVSEKFFQNTGEAGLSPYHLGIDVDIDAEDFDFNKFLDWYISSQAHRETTQGDLVWEIGTGYYGCRKPDGSFDDGQFERKARLNNVKMIEIKLSQGMEPCKSLPVKGLTPGIARVLSVPFDSTVALPPKHSTFSTPLELLTFVKHLRQLSGGKPVGIKLSIGQKHQFLAICKAMLKSRTLLDFVTVDGMEGGTSGSSKGAAGYTGTPLDDALVFVHSILSACNLRKHIKIIASGRVFTERDIISKLARGADICSTARAVLIAAGCNQQRDCYKGTCEVGIATQDPEIQKQLIIQHTAEKIANFHRVTLLELAELVSIAGLASPNDLTPEHLEKRISVAEKKPLSELYDFLQPGSLNLWFPYLAPASIKKHWLKANPNHPF